MNAIQTSESQISGNELDPVGTVSNCLEHDQRKMSLWEPKLPNYGGAVIPLLIGFDSEWKTTDGANNVLSYQFFALDVHGGSWRTIYYPKNERFGLPTLLACVIAEGLAKGLIREWPASIYLVAHFSLADLSTLERFVDIKALFDAIRRTYVTLNPKTALICRIWDEQRHDHHVKVILRDTMLLAPNGKQSLAALGDLVDCEKIELEDDEIENMDLLLVSNPERFRDYAERDPEICVRYAVKMLELNYSITGKAEVPPTLSGMGLSYLLRLWGELGIDRHVVLGTEVIKATPWSEHLQRRIRKNEIVPLAERHLFESFASECYHGGRNEQFLFGAGEEGLWTDWDLSGAYTTAMCVIGMPDWKAIRQTRDIDEFQPQVLGYARVRFRFPENTRLPCLPVRTANGLIFPLEGESYCCSPEIRLALRLGAQLDIVNGVILPASFNARPFEQFVIECASRRKSFTKGTLDELLWKEIGNSTYGKTAQGLHRKRVFDSRSGQHVDLPASQITNPYIAAYTTSFVRAVLGEIIAGLPLNRTVCSATTDGFLTNATDAEVLTATDGPLCRLFAQARLRISGDVTMLERKHRIAQPLGWRTRGQATLKGIAGEKPVLAKAGLKPPMKDAGAHNKWIVDTFVNRTADSKQTISTLRNLPEIWKKGGDLVAKAITRRINMDYDFKRRPVNPETRPINGVDHLYFDTVPWRSVTEFTACREQWEAFHASSGTVLKAPVDLADFDDYRAVNVASLGLKRSKKGAGLKLAQRQFLRAFTRSELGLDATAITYGELALWLTEQGYATSKSDVENAKRASAKLVKNCVPHTEPVKKFLATIKNKFPAFTELNLLTSC